VYSPAQMMRYEYYQFSSRIAWLLPSWPSGRPSLYRAVVQGFRQGYGSVVDNKGYVTNEACALFAAFWATTQMTTTINHDNKRFFFRARNAQTKKTQDATCTRKKTNQKKTSSCENLLRESNATCMR